MSHRAQLLAEKRAEIERLGSLSLTEVTPSMRDFAMFVSTQKNSIALVPRVKRTDPDAGASWREVDFAALARACDDADAAAVAVATAAVYGGSMDDLRTVADLISAPVLRDDWCLHPNQVYQARLHGADAVIVPAAYLNAAEMEELIHVANSVHMATVIEVTNDTELTTVSQFGRACIGLQCARSDGFVDVEGARALATSISRLQTVLLLSEVRELESLRSLGGLIDAAVVGNVFLDAGDPAALIRAWQD